MDRAVHSSVDIRADIQSKFAPVFALKSAISTTYPNAKTLSAAEQRLAWETPMAALPEILAQCSGISAHPDTEDFPLPLKLWDFFNGREIGVSVNKRGGYDLNIRAEEIRWLETKLPLDLLFLKLLALDYTPEEFRALRAHLSEFGVIVPKGIQNIDRLAQYVDEAENILPPSLVLASRLYLEQIALTNQKIAELTQSIHTHARANADTQRLLTIPGVGPVTAMAITAFAPAMETFERGRNFSAWLGLVPKQHSTGGRQILGRTSKMGQKDIRRLLIIGAMSVIKAALKKGAPEHSWLGRLLARKSRMVAGVALANKMARMIWAVLTGKDVYRDPEAGAAA